jgi:predicted nucleic acid-binding protein
MTWPSLKGTYARLVIYTRIRTSPRQRFQLSYWDSTIIEASRAMGCTEVLSEDLSDGQDYAGVRVTNPFR